MKSLTEAIKDYLALRRSLGFKLHSAGAALMNFASFMERQQAQNITTRLALEWAQQPPDSQPAHWAQRLSFVRGFARHHVATDPSTEVPPAGLLPYRPARARPYLYSHDEVRLLLKQALQLPDGVAGLRPWTYYALLGLLSVTGLRVGEALRLRLDDVDLATGVLTVRGTKFGKSRLVPIHASTRDVLADYAARRTKQLGGRDAAHLFVTRTGHALDGADVRRTFYSLSRQIGLRGQEDSHGPRLHDFRHRFAVETLMGWYRSGVDAERRLPVLSTYLGHVHVSDTYWYLSAHPQLMALAMARVERRWEDRS
ncbi:integrase [Pelomonas sp. Root1217]|uniref:tyrosine-type recombinase/integrase n=1 Tax=Pelomonas sp. Root1217 TaxID=1736430 RepID=UPI00070B2907|nr:tyrosine-type recombinase/integrase [Pelomonas sp. Root1217]KQV52602.1 integrase [Pelomonas sp. Root1217]